MKTQYKTFREYLVDKRRGSSTFFFLKYFFGSLKSGYFKIDEMFLVVKSHQFFFCLTKILTDEIF